jgi:hypothetical protein
MKKEAGLIVLAISCALMLGAIGLGAATSMINSSYTTDMPIIDGIISSEEWTNKIPIILNGYSHPENTLNGELYVMNDANTMYIAVVIPDNTPDADYLLLDFDQGNDNEAIEGREDALGFNLCSLYDWFPSNYTDLHWNSFWWAEDGTTHGQGAQRYDALSGTYQYEFMKPLRSGDIQDMALNAGDTIGFRIEVWDGTTTDWYRYPQNTVDSETSLWSEWADLVIAES